MAVISATADPVKPLRSRLTNPTLRWQIVPVIIFLALLFVIPVVTLLGLSFLNDDGALTPEHYQRLAEVPLYGKVLLITIRTAFWTMLLCVIGAYPIAYLLATIPKSTRNWLVIFVLMPLWTSFLVRTFAWIVLLGRKGALNETLLALHLIDEPVTMIYNFTGVMIGMTHALMPLAVLTMLSVMEGVDSNLVKAASTMGARRGTRFWRIYFPLSMPGVASAGLLVFITSLGFFITPALLGGPRDTMIVQLVIFQIRSVLNWQFAGAIGVLLLVTLIVIFLFYDRIFGLSSISTATNRGQQEIRKSYIGDISKWFGRGILRGLAALFDGLQSLWERFGIAGKRKVKVRSSRKLLWISGLGMIGFLALPTLFIVPVSFTSEAFLTWPPNFFSMQWYELVFDSPIWIDAAVRSVIVALCAASLGMLFAVPCAFALSRNSFMGKSALFALVVAPIIVPNIFIAVSLFFLFSRLGISGTTFAVILGHTVLVIPYVVVTVMAVVKGYDRNLDLAASIMGANRFQVFTRVTFPIIRSGFVASFMFAFIISFDELTIALFVTGGRVTTLPKLMYEDALLSVSPRLAAVATLLLIFMSIIILTSELIRRKGQTAK